MKGLHWDCFVHISVIFGTCDYLKVLKVQGMFCNSLSLSFNFSMKTVFICSFSSWSFKYSLWAAVLVSIRMVSNSFTLRDFASSDTLSLETSHWTSEREERVYVQKRQEVCSAILTRQNNCSTFLWTLVSSSRFFSKNFVSPFSEVTGSVPFCCCKGK